MAVTVLIVDDDAPFRSLARDLLEIDGFEVVGEAQDVASALKAVAALDPQVVLLDVHLPDGNGYDVADELVARAPTRAIVLVSSRPASTFGRRMRESGARGFVAKEQLTGAALAAVLAGGA